MENFDKEYQIYLNDVFKLAKTLTIHSTNAATLINDDLLAAGHDVNLNNKETWKYYLNISGQYHSTNTTMKVVSLDTLEEIVFNKANLLIHTETYQYYKYGSSYYYNLVQKFPNQEQLILGILYPVDINLAIDSDNGEILAYDKDLVKKQELTLIKDLSTWIKNYISRWDVKAFVHSDSLYSAAQHAILYLNIVPKILNLRLKRCKTLEAHDFHITKYLASHYGLDEYIDYYSLKQKLWLYRNILYISKNIGQQNILDWLIENILTERKIPIASYSTRYLTGPADKDPDMPDYRFKKNPLNTRYNVPEKDYFDLDELLSKEEPLYEGNKKYIESERDKIDYLFIKSNSNVIQTKVLESSMFDYGDMNIRSLESILMDQWAYLSSKNIYKGTIYFTEPRFNTIINLSLKDAFVYMMYISFKIMGITMITIKPYFCKSLVLTTKPSAQTLLNIVDKNIHSIGKIINEILIAEPTFTSVPTPSRFYKYFDRLHTFITNGWSYRSNIGDTSVGYIENIYNRLFFDAFAHFPDEGKLYSEWLADLKIEDINYTDDEYKKLLKNIFKASTNYYVDPTKVLANIQKAMIETVKRLTSYSIQFIREINENPMVCLNWKAIRFDLSEVLQKYLCYISSVTKEVYLKGKNYNELYFDIKPFITTTAETIKQTFNIEYVFDFIFEQKNTRTTKNIYLWPFHLEPYYANIDINIVNQYGILGYDVYLDLTEEQRLSIPDIY